MKFRGVRTKMQEMAGRCGKFRGDSGKFGEMRENA